MSTIAEIYDRLATSKASMQELHDYLVDPNIPGSILDSYERLSIDAKTISKVANWRLWLWIMAVGSWTIEKLFVVHKNDITAILEAKRPHTRRWYAEESKKFQYGYPLIWNDNQYQYERYDADALIVKYAAASELNGKVILKVANEVGGVKVPLTFAQKSIFTEFWTRWKDAGVRLEIISQAADLLKVDLTIVRDRLVLDANNCLLRDSSINPFLLAIDEYSKNLEFDGIIRLSKIVDAIQAAEGIVDVKLASAWHKATGGSWAPVDMEIEAVSGYFDLSLSESTLEFIDNINVTVLTL